ncbi:UNKNOWN [Stylonychia lemnae]|uniref:Uncharacterized protein n=1 Tax=Stylonychia lemnae TaxID=5949 RepID=A0A078B7D0_STYLE|nr:UNKNOWN [Stylonychia lemnae]|eukprot:CDW90385.1 UNKNOWN [Stylonychia lemnae]
MEDQSQENYELALPDIIANSQKEQKNQQESIVLESVNMQASFLNLEGNSDQNDQILNESHQKSIASIFIQEVDLISQQLVCKVLQSYKQDFLFDKFFDKIVVLNNWIITNSGYGSTNFQVFDQDLKLIKTLYLQMVIHHKLND